MSDAVNRLAETVTLSQACELIQCLASCESILLLSPPGVGKSDMVIQAAQAAGLPCRSLLGTQIAPEDVSGVPRIVGERAVFCPPRILLPESNEPFCLFLDELPACTPDIQKAFYSLLLERRLGEHRLPGGSWVVAAGNRAEDRALVRTISSALLNRVIVLNVRVDVGEWIGWAKSQSIDSAVVAYILDRPDALLRPVPKAPVPFSTPRAWALLSEALRLGIDETDRRLLPKSELSKVCRALCGGRISAEEVDRFSNYWIISQSAPDELKNCGYNGLLNLQTCELSLSQRAINALQELGLSRLEDLVVRDRKSLLRRGLDAMRLEEIEEGLARKGLWLGMIL